eukprot:Gb_29345 [translate_table: standard]
MAPLSTGIHQPPPPFYPVVKQFRFPEDSGIITDKLLEDRSMSMRVSVICQVKMELDLETLMDMDLSCNNLSDRSMYMRLFNLPSEDGIGPSDSAKVQPHLRFADFVASWTWMSLATTCQDTNSAGMAACRLFAYNPNSVNDKRVGGGNGTCEVFPSKVKALQI